MHRIAYFIFYIYNIASVYSQTPRSSCPLIKVFKTGLVTCDNKNAIIHPGKYYNLQALVQQVVNQTGPLTRNKTFLYGSTDTPMCNGLKMFSGPIIAYSNTILCDDVRVLPLSTSSNLQAAKRFDKDPHAWKDKITKAVWRGSHTGHKQHLKIYAPNMTILPRQHIVDLSSKHPTLLSASFKKIPLFGLFKYKFIVAVSGNSWASILPDALRSNSCVLLQDNKAYDWFEMYLKPWVHYVPVQYDLGDLISKIQWAFNHETRCAKIADTGKAMAHRIWTQEFILAHTRRMLET